MEIEQRFNPYKLFVGSFIPNCILRISDLSPTAKLCFARLSQYAGEKGECFPSITTLGKDIGTPKRTVFRALTELETYKLIKRIPRLDDKGDKTSNSYVFLVHKIYGEGWCQIDTTQCQNGTTGDAKMAHYSIRESDVKKDTPLQSDEPDCNAQPIKPKDPIQTQAKQPRPRSPQQQLMDNVIMGFIITAGVPSTDKEQLDKCLKSEYAKHAPYAKELLGFFNNNLDKCLRCTEAVATTLQSERLSWSPAAICRWKVDWNIQINKFGLYKGLGKGSDAVNKGGD